MMHKNMKHISFTEKENFVFDERKIGETLIDSAEDIATIVGLISGLLSQENLIGQALMCFFKKLKFNRI